MLSVNLLASEAGLRTPLPINAGPQMSDIAKQSATVPPKLAKPDRAYQFEASRNFRLWLAENRCSLAFSAYYTGTLFLLGLDKNGKLAKSTHSFSRCMGICGDADKIWASSLHQVWRFSNYIGSYAREQGYDRIYRPRVAHVTGDLDIHEMGETADGRLVFVNTLFSCLATLSDTRSFETLWTPPFISKVAAEDRCHLNGLAMKDGQPLAVTAIAQSDVAQGWREHRQDGGIIIDVASKEIVASGLSMPHSPRWAMGRLWVLNSGTGGFGYIEAGSGAFREVAFCPGYARGMAIHGRHAVIALSKPREQNTFGGLKLQDRLAQHKIGARCGLMIVDLETGTASDWLRIDGSVQELFGVAVLSGVRNPAILGDPVHNSTQLVAQPENTAGA